MPKLQRIVLYDNEKAQLINPANLDVLRRYKIDMNIRGLAESTQNAYVSDIHRWFMFIYEYQHNKSVTELGEDDLTEFLYFCQTHGNSSARVQFLVSTLSSFYKFLRKKRIIVENPLDFIDMPKSGPSVRVQSFLSPTQVALMREKLIRIGDIQLRAYAMFSISTMARSHAVASIKWSQVDFNSNAVHDVLEKEGKVVELYFSDEVKYALLELKKYREDHSQEDYGYVFHTSRTKDHPVDNSTLNNWCKQIGKLIDVPTLHTHDFRHTGASILLNAGMPLEDVSSLLHHESMDTTRKYYIKQNTDRICATKALYSF